MPRYYFHIREGENFVPDEDGMEFESFEDAKHEASESCRELVIDRLRSHQKFSLLTLEIADESGKVLSAIIARDDFN